MRVFFDTSVIIAAFHTQNLKHEVCFNKLNAVSSKLYSGLIANHSLAEIYSVLTRLPAKLRTSPLNSHQLISQNLLRHFQLVGLSSQEYLEVIKSLSEANFGGGLIYDALILKCAEKEACDEFLTLNAKHFRQIPSTLFSKIIEL
jgi:predicted nucleic acid-binding protein